MVRAIIQARMLSTRLPGKSLMYIDDYTLLDHVINSTKKLSFVDEVLVATTTNKEADKIEKVLGKKDVMRGHPVNVLDRFIEASMDMDDGDIIIRITADNPLNNKLPNLSRTS